MDETNLEHIFPVKPQASAWPNLASLEPLTWHIGNLTALSVKINQKSQNKGFVDKRDQHYADSEVEMTKELVAVPVWDEEAIKKRGAELVNRIAKRWPAL